MRLAYVSLSLSSAMLPAIRALSSVQDFLRTHNSVRSSVGVLPLSWTPGATPTGERRTVSSCSAGYTPADAVDDWVSERRYYDYHSSSCVPGQACGHYTQVVWADSVHLGCAQVTCDDGDTFVTCNYDPPGNVDGQRPRSHEHKD